MGGTPVSPALPKIALAFAGEPQAALLSRLVLTMPALFTVIGAPLAGVIADRFGRRPLAILSVMFYFVAGISGFFAETLYQILAGRAMLGLAVGGCLTAATTLITDYFSGEERAGMLGRQGAFSAGGGVIFIGLGGFLAEIGWRFPFLIYALALPVLVLSLAFLPEPKPSDSRQELQDRKGGLPYGLLAILFGVSLGGTIGFFAPPVQMPFLLQGEFAVGGVGAGLMLSLFAGFASLSAFNYARIRSRVSYGGIFTLVFGVLGLSYIGVGLATSVALVAVAICFSGAAAGLLLPAINNCISEVTDSSNRARVLGVMSTATFLGQFLSPIVMAPFVAALPSYSSFFAVFGAVLLLMGVGMKLLSGTLGRRTDPPEGVHDVPMS